MIDAQPPAIPGWRGKRFKKADFRDEITRVSSDLRTTQYETSKQKIIDNGSIIVLRGVTQHCKATVALIGREYSIIVMPTTTDSTFCSSNKAI